MAGFLLTMDDVTAVVWIEIARITQNFQESTDAFFSLLLSFLLHIDCLVRLVKMSEYSVDHLEKFKGCFVVKLHHTQVAHEGWSVETVNDDFNLGRVKIRRFVKDLHLIAA